MGIVKVDIKDDKLDKVIGAFFNTNGLSQNNLKVQAFKEDHPGEERLYEVYHISNDLNSYVLKKSNYEGLLFYTKYNIENTFKAPKLYEIQEIYDSSWVLIEYIKGIDLRNLDRPRAILFAKSLSEISNSCWVEKPSKDIMEPRMKKYYDRIKKRSLCLEKYPVLNKAYNIFLERQLECPRTLSHGDAMPYNVIESEEEVYLIDWEFSGIMPYSLDVARFIAHADEQGSVFYSNKKVEKVFLEEYFNRLSHTNIDYEEYIRDVKLASLNEYIEFLENDIINCTNEENELNPFFQRYMRKAKETAEEILVLHKSPE